MSHQSLTFTLGLILASSLIISGCDPFNQYTEQELIQRAKDFEDKGNLKASIIELKNALQKNPNNPQARLLLGQIYLKNGMGHEAEKELSQAEKLGVSHESIQIDLGEALLLMGEYSRVLNEIQPTEKTTPPNLAYIQQLHADALLRQGKIKEACNLFQQSLNTYKSHAPTFWGLAQCAVVEGNMNKAQEWLKAALPLKNRQAKTWIFIGDLEQLLENPKKSLEAYSQALRVEPNNPEALVNRAALYMALGQLGPAQVDAEKVSKLSPKSLAAYYLRGLLSFEQKKFTESRDAIQKALQMAPGHMPSLLLAGATEYSLGSYQQAESYLNRFLGKFPRHAYARRVLAATQLKQKHYDKALLTLSPLLSSDAGDAAALSLAGEAHLLLGEPAKATQYLEKASVIDPGNASIRTKIALGHLSMGDAQLGIAELAKAAAMGPDPQKADVLLVLLHLNRKEYDKAIAAVDALEKKGHRTAATHTMRGGALIGKKDFSRARSSFEQALALDPTFFPAVASLGRLDIHDKKPEVAQQRFERLLEKDKTNLQAMMALAELAATKKQDEKLVYWLERAAKAHPNAIPPRAVLARHFLVRKQAQRALALANEVVGANPDNPAALDLLGSVQMAINDYTSATSTYTKLAQQAVKSPDVYVRLAQAQLAGNKLADARLTLQNALKLQPNHAPSLDTLIRLEMVEKKPERALHITQQLQASQPQSALGFEREGDIHLSQRRPDLAAKAYERALAKGAGSSVFIKFHRTLALSGNPDAQKKLENWLARHPGDNALRFYAANYYASTGQHQAAIAAYQALLTQTPGSVLALNNLANSYQQVGDARAHATAEQAYKLDPQDPAILDTLGWILVEKGQVARGLALIEKALVKLPRNPDIRYHRAIALVHKGEKTRARKELESLLKDSPTFSQAEAAKAQLRKL